MKIIKLAAVLVTLFSFSFSSCKNCNGNKNKGKDNVKNNSVTDRDKDNSDNPAIDGDESVPALNDSDLTEVGRYLKGKGASDTEIREMMKIEKEDFGSDITDIDHIGHIVYNMSHYYYRDSNGDPHNGQSGNGNCGLYAMKRLLFVLGKHKLVDEDLWYIYTDKQLRVRVLGKEGDTIDAPFLRKLMKDIGVPKKHLAIYDRDGYAHFIIDI